jgi:hypothetical protein
MNPWKWVAAASILAAAASIFWAVSLNNQVKNLQAGTSTNDSIQQQLNDTRNELAQLRSEADAIRNPAMKMASLGGTATAPRSEAMIMWDSTSKDVYLMVRNLPRAGNDKQYQLWALLDGKPVDLGTFELRQERLLVKMKGVQAAQAFAITLEPKGGSATPTGDMYVYGKL